MESNMTILAITGNHCHMENISKYHVNSDNYRDIRSNIKYTNRKILKNAVESRSIYCISSSLGGFFARCLNLQFPFITSIMINPSLSPFLSLRKYGVKKTILYQYVRLFERFYNANEDGFDNLFAILGDSDEVIDHENSTKLLLPYGFDEHIHTIKGGTHQLEITDEVASILKNIINPPPIKENCIRRVLGLEDMRLP
ncbi:hypothetical protein LJC31_08020 [Synergistaceae bacterium OttesenSCG-928-I11]|nr:hypothetical protein [Synergistaceae bacterium OttesenSCG-928-I11]